MPSKPISLSLTLSSSPIFLFPIFCSDPPATAPGKEETTLRGEIHASVNVDSVSFEGVKVFWEVGVQQSKEGRGKWDKGVVFGMYEGVVVDFGKVLERGSYMIPFTITLPTIVPSSRETPFDKITHTLRASFTAPSPTYTIHDRSPIPSRKGSIASFADLHLSDNSRRGSGTSSTGGDDNSPPPFTTGAFVFPSTSTTESSSSPVAGPSTSILNRQSNSSPAPAAIPSPLPKTRFKLPFLNLESRRRSSLDRSAPNSRRTSIDGQVPAHPLSRQASSTSLAAQNQNDEEEDPEKLWEPSLGYTSMVVEVIGVPRRLTGGPDWRGDTPNFKWDFRENLRGLGGLEGRMSSNCFVLGSGLMADISLYDLSPLATIHSISLNLTQVTKTPDTLQVDDEHYTLFELGKPAPSSITDNIWQGDLSKANIAAQSKSKGKALNHNSTADQPNSNTFEIKRRVRLPSPAIGAFARYAFTPHPPYSTQTEHDLRLAIIYSVYGQTSSGNPYPPHIKPPVWGGGVQSARLFYHVYMYDCSASPSNLVLPVYGSAVPELKYVEKVEAKNMPGSFTIPRKTSRTAEGVGMDIRGELGGRGGLVERVERHRRETGGRCLCLLDEADVWRAVGDGKDEDEDLPETQGADEGSTAVKATFET